MGVLSARVVVAARDDDPEAMTRAWADAVRVADADPGNEDAAEALALIETIDIEVERGASLPAAADSIDAWTGGELA
jgi:hypothetical protein